ncbi:MAG TPA: FCD domain-containing protein, partial [Candidatus Binatia bacterium]|nr:FCD domain-containing protein [Candidatus Binatia bacterium]
DYTEELQLGLQLHRIIAEATGNALLYDVISRILDKFQHFIWLELLWLDEWDIARKEHAEIVEAICSGQSERAADLARRHVRGSRDNILRILQARTAHRAALARVP